MRLEFPRKMKAMGFLRAEGRCEVCGMKIIGRAEFDHIVPLAIGGESTLTNLQVTCPKCHRIKTGKVDVPRIAKTKRIAAKHNGTWPKSPTPLRSRGFRKRHEVDRST